MGIYVVSGRPRAGKTAYVTTLAMKALKSGRPVFSNYPIVFRSGRYVYKSLHVTEEDVKTKNFPYGSMLIFDEANMGFNARNFKSFTTDHLQFFTQGSHLGYDMYLISQHPQRLDVSIREIPEYILEVRKVLWTKICIIAYYDIIGDYGITDKAYRRRIWRHSVKSHMSYDHESCRSAFADRTLKIQDHANIEKLIEEAVSNNIFKAWYKSKKESYLDMVFGKYKRKNEDKELYKKHAHEKQGD